MPDNKLTDNEIIKAFEYCLNNKDCIGCVADKHSNSNKFDCLLKPQDILDLINRLQKEIWGLNESNDSLEDKLADYRKRNEELIIKLNRLQAENENYSKNNQTMTSDILKLYKELEQAKAENERLEAECDRQYEIAEATIRAEIADGGTSCHWCEDIIKDEAYKECIEKVKEKANKSTWVSGGKLKVYNYTILAENLDNLLKELVGEDK